MTHFSTSTERVDDLLALSDKVYPVIDAVEDGQARARRLLRLGMAVVAESLASGTVRYAGDRLHRQLIGGLAAGGLTTDDAVYEPFDQYRRRRAAETARPLTAPNIDAAIDSLAVRYADVRRATHSRDGSQETDAAHVIHLGSLALPYAAQYYPHLEQEKIALYCLLHDVVEAYAGDVPSLGASDDVMRAKQHAEAAALARLETDFSAAHPTLVRLIQAYEHLTDDESRFVKTFDKLDPAFTHYYSNGAVLTGRLGIRSADEFFTKIDATSRQMQPYSGDFPDLLRDREELHHRVAEKIDWLK